MNEPNTIEPFDAALDLTNQAQIDQVLREMEWETYLNTTTADIGLPNTDQMHYSQMSDNTTFEDILSQSELTSPGSMTTGSTNPSPLVPLLDYDLGLDTAAITADAYPIFPELMAFPVGVQDDWMTGGVVPDFDLSALCGPTSCSESAAPITPTSGILLQQDPVWKALTMENDTFSTVPGPGCPTSSNPPAPSGVCDSGPSTSHEKSKLTCPYCTATFTDKTKLKLHTNKHTKPFRCSAAGCDYASAEKKSLQRHLLAKSKWDEEHRLAAQDYGLEGVKYRCPRAGCTYSTIREDNLKRHLTTCP